MTSDQPNIINPTTHRTNSVKPQVEEQPKPQENLAPRPTTDPTIIKRVAGVEVFTGFNIKYPEYSVITPQTLKEFTVRSLTVDEEEQLKGSLLTPNKLADHLNQVIYQCVVKKPEEIKTYEDFLNNITIKDRDALMYGLYHVTYKDIHNYDVTCIQCERVNPVKINFLKSFKAEMWPKDAESVMEKEISVNFEIANNITAVIKQPKLIDETNLLKEIAFSTEDVRDLSLQLLIIDRFEMDRPDAKTPAAIRERDNILKGYKQLPSTDRKLIDKAYEQNFGKYGVDILTKVRCQGCGNEEEVSIDLVRQFFRAIYG